MWDKPQLLNMIANMLITLSVLIGLYVLGLTIVRSSHFPLEEVRLDGELKNTSKAQVQLIVNKRLKGNFFTIDLHQARLAFEKLPWVRTVSLRRRWPNRLDVTIEEHVALARWGTTAMVNTQGELFYAAVGDELPVFNGPDDAVIEMAWVYAELNQLLRRINLKVAVLNLSDRYAWDVVTDQKMDIMLGRSDMADKGVRAEMLSRMERFVKVYETTIAGLNKKIQYVDLRYPNGFAIKKPTT